MKPVLQALVLAERIYKTNDGRFIICGTFNHVVMTKREPNSVADPVTGKVQIPGGSTGGSPYLYLSLNSLVEKTELSIQFVSLKKNKVLYETAFAIECKDRLATVELDIPLPKFPPMNVEDSGSYAFEVVCEGEILGACRVQIEVVEKRLEG